MISIEGVVMKRYANMVTEEQYRCQHVYPFIANCVNLFTYSAEKTYNVISKGNQHIYEKKKNANCLEIIVDLW